MGLRKGLVLLLSMAALGALAACLPGPDEPVEWVRREDAVIIQMKVSGGYVQEPDAHLLDVPEFTLYGDGTLIFIRPDENGRRSLFQAELPEEVVRDLLEFILERDFLDFSYDVEHPGVEDADTTFLYVHTKTDANAARAYGLEVWLPRDPVLGRLSKEERKQFQHLVKIRERLEQLDPIAEGGRIVGPFIPEAAVLVVGARGVSRPGLLNTWPFPEIDLAAIPTDTKVGEQRVPKALVPRVLRAVEGLSFGGEALFRQGGRTFAVSVRPVLPYEEHFPEFDQP